MAKLSPKKKKAFTLVEMLFVTAIIAILIGVAVPNFIAARSRTYKDMCVNNLRQIELAKQQWALENDKATGSAAPAAGSLDTYIKDGTSSLICPLAPASATFEACYDLKVVGTKPTCKVSTGHSL